MATAERPRLTQRQRQLLHDLVYHGTDGVLWESELWPGERRVARNLVRHGLACWGRWDEALGTEVVVTGAGRVAMAIEEDCTHG